MGNNPQAETQGQNAGTLNDLIRGEGPGKGRWAYYTPGLTEQGLQNSYSGMQSREMGQAGQAAGAQAGAFGATNPYAWIQHAQGQIGNKWADIMAQAPMQAFQSQMQSKGAASDMLMKLLAMQQGLAGQQEGSWGSKFVNPFLGSFGSALGNTLGGAPKKLMGGGAGAGAGAGG